MSGMTDYTAENFMNYIGGRIGAPPTLSSLYLALFTTAPTSDSGVTGATEVSGGGYARVQVAGALAAGGSFTTSSTTITLGSTAPAWLLALGTVASPGNGVNVYDLTNSQQIGVVSSVTGTTVTLQSAAAHASSGSTDSLLFSAFGAPSASSGSEPAVTPAQITNNAVVNFAQATASWGTATSFGLFDAATSGNNLEWDYIGAFPWQPCTISAASPGVFTAHANGFAAADNVVFTAKNGGTTPTFSASNLTGLLAVVSPTTDTFTVTNGGTAVNTSGTGNGNVRKVVPQPIAINVTASFAASTLTLTAA